MQRILLYLLFFTNILFIKNLQGQTSLDYLRLDLPGFVPAGKIFSTSVVFRANKIADDKIEIKFKKSFTVNLKAAYMQKDKKLNLLPIKIGKEQDFAVSIDTKRYKILENEFYQFFIEVYVHKAGKIGKSDLFTITEAKNLNNLSYKKEVLEETEVYENQSVAEKTLKLNQNSSMRINFKDNQSFTGNLFVEFWINNSNNLNNFFLIKKTKLNDTLITFSANKFNFISIPVLSGEIYRKDYYLGKNSWNYVNLLFSKKGIDFICDVSVNSERIYSTKLSNLTKLNELELSFVNKGKKSFKIERLKIWDFKNSIDLADKNKHFLSYDADSSIIIFQTNFDNTTEYNSSIETNRLNIFSKKLAYAKSDAPLFSKAPKLVVNIGSAYNSIVWYVQEYSVAKEFVVERALNNGKYKEIFRTTAEDDPLKIYYYTDEILDDNVVAYYRIKQLNLDKSKIYSPEVKIGNQNVTEFKLSQNYPNPFNPITSIYVEVLNSAEYHVNVYDLVGNNVAKLHNGFLQKGMHTFKFDGSTLPSGIYFYEVKSPKANKVKKMILAK
ncbi:MAG: hypothetical protein CR986_09380 [Ignavibacteriae bacterium]|nr:MAG: hypothetical protein CR986_09380 [Ignavibacteriota bacterium]